MRFLSFGAGIQTTGLLLMDNYDLVIFADTGSEKDQTYQYIEKFVKPYCKEKGMKFVTVYKMIRFVLDMWVPDSLGEWCRRHHNVPSIKYRWSTRDWKLRPIARYIKSLNIPEDQVSCVIGISKDEDWRTNEARLKGEPYTKEFPLVKNDLTREDCADVIRKHGWPLPPKSGCYFCPFQTISQWNWLFIHDYQKYKTSAFLEENCRVRHPHVRLNAGYPSLEVMKRKAFTFQLTDFPSDDLLEDQVEIGCDIGYCNR